MGNSCECVNVDQNHTSLNENMFIDLNSNQQFDMQKVLEDKNGLANKKEN